MVGVLVSWGPHPPVLRDDSWQARGVNPGQLHARQVPPPGPWLRLPARTFRNLPSWGSQSGLNPSSGSPEMANAKGGARRGDQERGRSPAALRPHRCPSCLVSTGGVGHPPLLTLNPGWKGLHHLPQSGTLVGGREGWSHPGRCSGEHPRCRNSNRVRSVQAGVLKRALGLRAWGAGVGVEHPEALQACPAGRPLAPPLSWTPPRPPGSSPAVAAWPTHRQ